MILAGVFGAFLFVALVISDWVHFSRLAARASSYGCRIARTEDHVPVSPAAALSGHFDAHGVLQLPHGVARLFPGDRRILLRAQHHLFAVRFRTAWPLKGTIELHSDGERMRLLCSKRMPWSSAVLTALWFGVVTVGTLGFLASFAAHGGFATLRGAFMGLGVTGFGFLVLTFGLIIVTLAYRLEDHRLSQAYQELRHVLASASAGS